ncbi:AMPKBI-domain-containing protein [Coemansia reversa NRRL 1564]|uniref:AMPKBI-domain-containing protein n=1 Tax=Coemansia reversa (strain ATCC 12441 / NRRL 1564) TaxID=763665 RepID=A0A2G5BKK3_COERN|nr:AMPKBI-domain-containing protein [Coemansia reversa NRRL 1564]|eukprot:PIA19287.1 AMPKBI-domain-containing protein [Coemansia reversa NRRL 1564]
MGNTQSAEGEGGSRKHGIHQGGSGEGGATGHSGGGGGSLAHRLSRRSKPAAATAAVPMPTVKVSTENTTSNNQYNSQQHRRSQNKHTLGVGPVDMLSPVVGSPLPDSSLTQGLPAGMAVNKYEAGRGPIHMGMPETIPQTLPNQSGLAQMMAARKITAEETGRSPLSGISDDRIHWMGEGTGDSGLVNEKISLAGNTTDDDYDKMHNAVPTLIRWTEPCQGVYISGSFVDWQFKIKLHEDDGMFGVVLDLPVGTHRLKYIVDGKWRCSNRFIIAPDEDGNLVNYFKVESVVKEIDQEKEDNVEGLDAATLSNSPPGEYGIAIPDLDKIARESSNSRRNEPPLLPPHLNQVLLNSLEIRHDDPNVLPVPNHVVLNHLYACSIKNNVMAVSSTSRYRGKYMTTIYYKPVMPIN